MRLGLLCLGALITVTGGYAELAYRECQESDRPNSDGQFRKQVQNPSSYNLIAGFGESAFSFSPDEIEIVFDSETACNNTTTANIVSIHAHDGDGDEKKQDRNDVEKNFSIQRDNSYFFNVLTRNLGSDPNMNWLFYGKMLKLKSDYEFNLNSTASAGDDPINGSQNTVDMIQPNTKFLLGTEDAPCRTTMTGSEDAPTISYANDTLEGPCPLQYVVSVESVVTTYNANIQLNGASMSSAGTLFNLIRESDNAHVGYVRLNLDTFTFDLLDLEREVLE